LHKQIYKFAGGVDRESVLLREDDARSYDVVLSLQGRKLLKAANRAHLLRVRELFIDHLSETQIMQLVDIWNAVDPRFIAGNSGSDVGERPASGR
jgi:hypothetical protein